MFRSNVVWKGTIIIKEVLLAFRAKELKKRNGEKHETITEGLNVKKFKKPNLNFKNDEGHLKKDSERSETRKYHYCKKQRHLKKDCYSWKRKQAHLYQKPATTDYTESNDMLRC